MQKLTFLFLIVTLFGCAEHHSKNEKSATGSTANTAFTASPLIIENDEGEGWGGDLKLSITEIKENDTAKIYKAVSTHEGANLGLLVIVPKAKGKKGFDSGLTLSSI